MVVADASAMVKLVIDEAGTVLTHQLWDTPGAWVAPTLVLPEVASAISAAGRDGRLSPDGVDLAHRSWRSLSEEVALVTLDPDSAWLAAELAAAAGVRGADAVYLAVTTALAAGGDVALLSFDVRLRAAAEALGGVALVPASLDQDP